MPAAPATVDEYIAGFPPEVQAILQKVRATVRKAAPGAEEVISYQMPALKLNGRPLIYFGAFKKHIGLYPPVSGSAALKRDAARYAGPKGNLQFPLDERIPYGLISRIVKAKVRESRERAAAKARRLKRA
jgi:uncharacterized protein YdhG (YjbR/CyaY superfamily)